MEETAIRKTVYVRLKQFTTQSETEKIRQELQKHSTDLICILPAYTEIIDPEKILKYRSVLLKFEDGFKGSSQEIMTMIEVYRKMEKSGEESKDDGGNDADH